MAESFFSEYMLEGEPDRGGRELSDLLWGVFTTPVTAAIADLNIAGILGDGKLTAAEIAQAAATDPDATLRLLRAGVSAGLLTGDGDGRYALTEKGRWLRPDVSGVGAMAGFVLGPMAAALAGLADHVREGRKVDPAAPGGFWEWLGQHPREVARFSKAMGFVTTRVLAGMTAVGYRPPEGVGRIVDVGGNRGTVLAWLLQAVPEATGVLFDLPESLAAAPEFLAAQRVADRAELIGGSFFDQMPAGDLHVLSNLLHDWGDDQARQIVEGCARASRPGAWLVLIENGVPSGPEPSIGPLLDVAMMAILGGRERTLEENRALIEPVGYTLAREVPIPLTPNQPPPWRVLEFQRT